MSDLICVVISNSFQDTHLGDVIKRVIQTAYHENNDNECNNIVSRDFSTRVRLRQSQVPSGFILKVDLTPNKKNIPNYRYFLVTMFL